MPYLPVVNGPWGYRRGVEFRLPGMTDDQVNEYALRDMCDYGARQVALGKADELEFRLWPNEKDYIDAYMAERHPKVLYRLQWPVWSRKVTAPYTRSERSERHPHPPGQ